MAVARNKQEKEGLVFAPSVEMVRAGQFVLELRRQQWQWGRGCRYVPNIYGHGLAAAPGNRKTMGGLGPARGNRDEMVVCFRPEAMREATAPSSRPVEGVGQGRFTIWNRKNGKGAAWLPRRTSKKIRAALGYACESREDRVVRPSLHWTGRYYGYPQYIG